MTKEKKSDAKKTSTAKRKKTSKKTLKNDAKTIVIPPSCPFVPDENEQSIFAPDIKNTLDREKTCFIMMPFGSNEEYSRSNVESNYVFNHIICPALSKVEAEMGIKIKTIREVDRNIAGSITKNMYPIQIPW